MSHYIIKKGLDIPIKGKPDDKLVEKFDISSSGLIGDDFVGLKPKFLLSEGDSVKIGDKLFFDKKNEAVFFTSPVSGIVKAINRGEKRKFLSIEIERNNDVQKDFKSINQYNPENIINTLIETGLFVSFNLRPFGKIPNPDKLPDAIFISLLDTRPLSGKPEIILKGKEEYFNLGLKILSKLARKIYLSTAKESNIKIDDIENLEINTFEGPHPTGLTGTQIYHLYPVNLNRNVWEIDYQNLVSIGYFFANGKILTEKTIALSGPSVIEPKYIKTIIGANIEQITKNEIKKGEHRVISGSVLYGHHAQGALSYLGYYHNQISVIPEDNNRYFMGWAAPGKNKYSLKNVFLSRLFGDKEVIFNTNLNGSKRPVVPIGSYEKVTPFDFEMTYLLRALLSEDWEKAEMLGAIELLEEDLSLCTFVCSGKNDYAVHLRKFLDWLEKEG